MPAPRPRVTRHGTYNDPRYTAYKQAVALQCKRHFKEPIRGAVRLTLSFVFAVPKSWSKIKKAEAVNNPVHVSKPDVDNLIKGVKDALNGIAYIDDAQVSQIHAVKLWGSKDKIVIEVEEV